MRKPSAHHKPAAGAAREAKRNPATASSVGCHLDVSKDFDATHTFALNDCIRFVFLDS
jgi:hypothetical protein